MRRDVALKLLGITRHHYYYKPRKGKRGAKPSTTTERKLSTGKTVQVAEKKLIDQIIKIKSDPELDYGYKAMTAALQLKGFVINKKKVYRLMKKYHLLHEKRKAPGKTYVKHRRVNPSMPLEVIEMDIKFQWVMSHQRYAFILTAIDCFTRKTLYWQVSYAIKKEQVVSAWESVIVNYLQPFGMMNKDITIEIRNDNDSRFAAKVVQEYLLDNGLNQVFTHPYTPEENGHVESFHAILGKSLNNKGAFETIADLDKHLKHFYHIYNNVRLHGSLNHLCPEHFWVLWEKGMIKSTTGEKRAKKHWLIIPHHELSGNDCKREASGSPHRAKQKPAA